LGKVEADRLAATCAALLDEKRADDILMLNVRPLTSLGEYFLLATARNARHLRAMARDIEDTVEELGKEPLGMEGVPESGWMLVDLGDVVVHLFDEQRRDLYQIEMLWGDADREDWHSIEALPGVSISRETTIEQ
jgi:ribosome-associated protein